MIVAHPNSSSTGCIFGLLKTDVETADDRCLCPFCRKSQNSPEENLERTKSRAANDHHNSIHQLGAYYTSGDMGLPQDYEKAIELRLRAGELGNASSYFSIASAYTDGLGVNKSMAKAMHFFELAAMNGDVKARHNLGSFEVKNKNFDRAMKHYMIAAAAGYDRSLAIVKLGYSKGSLSKDDFGKALRDHKESQDEMRSEQRDVAAKLFRPNWPNIIERGA